MKYILKKGHHYSQFFLKKLFVFEKSHITKSLLFPVGTWYGRNEVQYTGWNKLPGISGINIHGKSCRLVWQPNFEEQGMIDIAIYVYGSKESPNKWLAKKILTIDEGNVMQYEIIKHSGFWNIYYKYNGLNDSITINANTPKCNFKTHCYFGGKSVSPKNITIIVN